MFNHFGSFKTIYYLSLIFGVGVMALKVNQSSPGIQKISNLSTVVPPIVWFLMLLFNDVTRIVDKDNILNIILEISKNKEQELTIKVIMAFEYWISNCLMLFNIVSGVKHIRDLPSILSTLCSVEKDVGRYFDPIRLRHIHKKEAILIRGLVLLCLLVTGSPIVVSYTQRVHLTMNLMDYVQVVIKDLSKFIIFTVEIQFSAICIFIYLRMELINNLYSRSFLRNENAPQLIEIPSHNLTQGRFQGYKFEQRTRVDKYKILSLTKQNHEIIFRLCEDLRRTYEFQLMCSVAEIFVNIINHVYITVKMFRPGELSYWGSVISLMWAVQEIVRVIVLSLAASVTANEVNRTLQYSSSTDVFSLGMRIRHQIKCLNLHLQHRKLKFSLCQMVTINTTFLAGMTVGIVNSLMLFLQYKYSDKQSLSTTG